MKDIKSLYLAAKNSRKKNDISAYAEAVHEMFENSPNDYISNLEYIIQSDIGIRTLTEFVDKYGLPISCFDTVMEHLETCIEKCNRVGVDDTLYQEAAGYMKDYRQKYIGCFMMEAFFNDECPDDYIKTYYGINESGVPNRKLAAGLLEKFREYAIPDIIVTADNIGGNAMDTVLEYIESHSTLGSPATCEWVLECVKNLVPESNGVRAMMESRASSGILRSLRERNHQSYREAVITGNDDIMLEYSDDEINAIQDLISINEYKVTWVDELNESATDIQNTIYSLYEEFAGLENEDGPLLADESVADSVIPMLPGSTGVVHPMQERPWLVNTRNKKTGDIPGYIKRNHNLGYGEDDGSSDHGSDGDSSSDGATVDAEPTLDDFKRPSAEDMSTPYSGLDEPKEEPEKLTPAEQKAINNYYYYTYNNSLNKNTTGSFNRDHSTHTSTSTKKTVDDHSKNKRVNSDNINTTSDDEDEFKPVGEDADVSLPWKLNIFDDVPFTEGALGILAGIVFFGPIVLGTGSIIAMMISSKAMKKKYAKKVCKVISDILGKSVSDDKKFLGPAKKMFSEVITKNNTEISSKFYKLKESGEDLDLNPSPFFSFGMRRSDNKDVSNCGADDLMICAENVAVGLMKKEEIKSITERLNKISPDVKFGFTIDDNLPGDDNGGNWSIYIKAGICEGGPEDNKDDDDKWIEEQMSAIKKSGYVVVEMAMTMAAKKFILDNFGDGSNINEAVGDADKDRPQSDHPVKDILTDVDRALVKKQQGAKKAVQNVQNAGRAFVKPAVRTTKWVDNMVHNWKDADENSVKEKLADPHARSNLFSAIRTAIVGGSLLKAGLLLNPVFLGLSAVRKLGKNKKEFRIRNEMIGELKTEMEIIDEKIKDADRVGDNKAKYKLMRFKNELNKKLLRVGGPKGWKKII